MNKQIIKLEDGRIFNKKNLEMFKSIEIFKEREHKSEVQVYHCVLNGKLQTKKFYKKIKAVYVLFNKNVPVYSGQTYARDIFKRPLSHKTPGKYQKKYDRFTVIALPDDCDLDVAETYLIHKLTPFYNNVKGGGLPISYKRWRQVLRSYNAYKNNNVFSLTVDTKIN